jgi:RNA polymerase sigma-70 factor (ECF subfamily)
MPDETENRTLSVGFGRSAAFRSVGVGAFDVGQCCCSGILAAAAGMSRGPCRCGFALAKTAQEWIMSAVSLVLEPITREEAMDEPRDVRAELAEVFANTWDALYRYVAVRVGGDEALADDCMQQTCLEAARSKRAPGREELELWLRGIARNVIRRHWRRARLAPKSVAVVDRTVAQLIADAIDRGPLPPEWLVQKEVRDQLLLAITELMAPEQNVIYRFYFAGESCKELAEALGVSVRSVEGRLYRARAELRRKLAHLADA